MSEILAPCGTSDALTAAVNSGADAVYLGGRSFNARQSADNFDNEQLIKAVEFCHRNSVKVYLTLNTIIFDNEIKALTETITAYSRVGADALIIQDLGVARLAREIVPDMPLHASTQMTVNSVSGAELAKELGFSRVVLGRELSFEQIKEIISGCDIETELFIHGALCVSVSGQCYMSAMLGGRSANRGSCAQPCRLGFSCGDRQNVLSLKDLSLVDKLTALRDIGVTSFKIEGRMKRPEYVAAAVNACRAALEGNEPDISLLRDVFSRSGFTDGYYTGDMNDMQGIRTKDDVGASMHAVSKAKNLYSVPYKRYKTDISVNIMANKPIFAAASVDGLTVTAEGKIPEKALSKEITEQTVITQMGKLGGTAFYAGNIAVSAGPGLSVSLSELNELRRNLTDKLAKALLEKNTRNYKCNNVDILPRFQKTISRQELRCSVYNAEQLAAALSEKAFSLIYAPMELLDAKTPDKHRIIAVPPVFLGDCEEKTLAGLSELKGYGFEKTAVHTLSHIMLARRVGMSAYGTFRLNSANRYTLRELLELGVRDTVLSPELTLHVGKELCLGSQISCGVIAYGSLPLMLTRRCPIKNGRPCGSIKRGGCPHFITDRYGKKMPCICSDNAVEILNPDRLYLGDKQEDTAGFDFLLMNFTDEEDIIGITKSFLNRSACKVGFTRGLYYKGTSDMKKNLSGGEYEDKSKKAP